MIFFVDSITFRNIEGREPWSAAAVKARGGLRGHKIFEKMKSGAKHAENTVKLSIMMVYPSFKQFWKKYFLIIF